MTTVTVNAEHFDALVEKLRITTDKYKLLMEEHQFLENEKIALIVTNRQLLEILENECKMLLCQQEQNSKLQEQRAKLQEQNSKLQEKLEEYHEHLLTKEHELRVMCFESKANANRAQKFHGQIKRWAFKMED